MDVLRRIFLSVFVLVFLAVGVRAARIVVVDSDDHAPLVGAAVISSRGVIKGLTDDDGVVTNLSSDDFPISVRLIGYRDSVFNAVTDTVPLVVNDFRLPEVSVSTAARPVTRMLCYVREYSTGSTSSDTLQVYSEVMADVFLADKGVKGYKDGDAKPRLLAERRFARKSDSKGLDSVYVCGDDERMLSFIDSRWSVPPRILHEPERIMGGERTDTVYGKYGPKHFIKKSPTLLTYRCDALADQKGHVVSPWFAKLFGLTMDIVQAETIHAYIPNNAGVYDVRDFASGGFSLRFIGKGKGFKYVFKVPEAIEISSVVELYPVDVTHLTIEEYKELRKDKPEGVKFVQPDIVPELHPAVQSIVDRMARQR